MPNHTAITFRCVAVFSQLYDETYNRRAVISFRQPDFQVAFLFPVFYFHHKQGVFIMSLYEENNQFRAELEQQVKNVDIREITQLPNFKNWFNSKKAHSKCYDYDLPKLFYRTLNSIDNLDNIVNGNEQSRFVGEYFTDDLDTALTYVEHLENSKILIGFLNIQNPAIIDCKGAGWNEIRQNATVTEQLAYFEYLGFNEKPNNFEENRAYPIDLRNDEKDEGISFFLQIKTINKDTTPSFIKITAPQYYQNDRSFRKTKFINLDMLGYGTPSLFNDIGTTNFWATNLAHRHRFDSVIFENLNDDGGRGVILFEKSVKKRKMQGTVVCAFDRENSYFKHANNHGDFNPDDRRIFYSLFDIEQDFKQEKTEKDKTMENQQLSGSPEQELPKYDKYIARYIRDFVNDDSNFHAWKGDKVKWSGWASLYYLEKLANRNGGIEHFAKLFEQYKSRNRIDFNQTWRYRYMDETIKMLRNPVSYKEKVEQSLSKIRQELKEIDTQLNRDENFGTPERSQLRETFDDLLSAQSIAMDKLTVVEDHIQTLQRRQENQTMQQTQATQQTAAQGGFSLPVENQSDENTVNYDLRGLPEFSGSVAAYFNNSERQELVLAFLKTAERSSDLRHQHFIGIHPKQQVQFDRIAAFSPLELSAILDCKPEFANNMREYIAVVEDFEHNHQQQQEAHKKAADALRISPAYQEMNDKRKNWSRIDLYSEYIDGGEKFARAKTGEITNAERLKNAMHNAIDAIAPAVKYSMSQTEFWQERDDKAFIKQSQIRDLLRSQMSFPAEMVEVKTRHQIWYEDRDMHDTLSKSTAGFFTPKNGKTVVIADAFIDNPELAVFTAYHELGHRGIELQGRELWNDWLQQARQNPTVRAIADHAQVHYASKGNILSDIAATEEALVEVFAAYKTQNWNYLEQRHNVAISQEFRQPQGTAEKLWHAAKNRIGQIFGRQSETVSDAAVFAMLGKLEQSLYQFPEWKQKLEKTVRVGQHNPFVVAKQPSLSGSLRVNPTALTNRYRSGGLRFDLNTQDNSDFAKAVDDIAANGKPKGTFFNLGTTPEVWQLIGIQDMPVDIHSDVMIKSVSEYLNLPPQYYRDGREKGQHNLSPETLKQIPAQLNNPVAIFKSADTSTNPNGYVVLTELIEHDFNTGKEKPVIAALDIRKVGQQKIEVVNITSIYGRWDWQIEKAVEHLDKQGNKASDLLYWHTTKGHQLSNSFGLRLPTWLNSLDDLSNRNIKTEQDLLQYQKDKEMEKNQQQGTTTPEISENTVKFDAFSQSEKENTMNETEKQALAQAFKNLELPDRKYVVKGSLVEFQDRPESEIIAALAWDEFATAVKDYVNSQSDENAEKLSNAYLAYPFYNELANKGIRDDSSLRNRYAKVIESEFSSFHEKRTAALFILQSMWRGRGNSTDITRSYNIDAMTAYIARGRELRSGWRLENRVNEYFLTKNSIFTHKNLREMGLDNNSNLAPYAPELLQEMVKIEEQYRVFSQWQNQNSEGGWYNRGAENIIDFKQIPAAVQKDLILMVSDRYLSKRDMFGVYDNPVISMQHGLAVRSEVQRNLEILIRQQEKELQQYQKMGLGVPVPQEDAITQQINAYKETLEQVKNAPAVAFVPETLFVRGETKPDWRTGEVQRYKITEISTKTGEIAFVNDPNNPNPNPFGDMTEQARQYLSANNNFALDALGVAPRKMPENMKFDDFGTTETEPRLGDEIITLTNGKSFAPVISAYADEQLVNADFVTASRTLGERFPLNYDDYLKFENHQSKANFFYCFDTNEVVIFAENPSKEQSIFNIENTEFYGLKDFVQELKQNQIEKQGVSMPTKNVETQPESEPRLGKAIKLGNLSLYGIEDKKANAKFEKMGAEIFNTITREGSVRISEDEFNQLRQEKYNLYYFNHPIGYGLATFGSQDSGYAILPIYKPEKYGLKEFVEQINELRQDRNVNALYDYVKSQPENQVETQPESISASPSIEKREEVFNMIAASGVMNTAWNGDETHGTESVLDTPFINKSLYYQDGELVYKDANYEHFETPDIFKISKQDFERHSPQAIALAVMKGVEEYKKMYRPEKAPEQSPTKRNDLQHTVNVGLQQYDNMFSPEIQKTHRLDILASQEKHRSHSVSGSPKEQTAENGGIFSPENAVKFDDFGVSESMPFAEVKQDAFGTPETPKTLTPQEQALADGKAMTAADEKVGDTKWELDKQPNNPERQVAYQQAIAEREELHNEIKQRVSDAMDKGEPYVIRYDEVPTAPFNGEKAPIELVVTQKGNLRLAIGTLDKPHNLTAVDSTPELALNTEQRSSPQRTAEVLRERFNQPTAVVADRLACINYPAEVFSEQEIKDALNNALKSPLKTHQLAALHSPQMKDEWLKSVAEKHSNPEVIAAAHKVLAERQALSSPTLSDNIEPENHTANKGGFSSPEHEEELATVVDDDGYERD